MSDTPCVDGCGQDAATIERLRAEVADLRAVQQAITECRDDPAGAIVRADRIAGEAILRALDAEAKVARAEALADRWRYEEMPDPTTADVDLRAALSPQNHDRSAAHAPEVPGQPGRDERGPGGGSGQCAAPSPMTGKPCQRLAGHERYAPQHWGPACGDEWEATDARP